MSNLSYTYPTLSTTPSSLEVDQNFADIRDTLNGNIDSTNIATDGVTLAEMLYTFQEFTLTFTFHPVLYGDVWPAAGVIVDTIPLPPFPFTVTGGTWVCTDTGSASGAFDIVLGSYNGSGDWAPAATGSIIVNNQTMTTVADGKGNSGGVTIAESELVYNVSTADVLALEVATQGTGVANAAPDTIKVTLVGKRVIQ